MNLVVDSSILIAAAHYRPYRNLLDAVTKRGRILISSVVIMELYAGFKSREARRAFATFHLSLKQAGKIVVPQHEDFLLGGQILFHLSQKLGHLDFKDHFRDGIIAVSAPAQVPRSSQKIGAISNCGGMVLPALADGLICTSLRGSKKKIFSEFARRTPSIHQRLQDAGEAGQVFLLRGSN